MKKISDIFWTSFVSIFRAIVGLLIIKIVAVSQNTEFFTLFVEAQNKTAVLHFILAIGANNLLTIVYSKKNQVFGTKYNATFNLLTVGLIVILSTIFLILKLQLIYLFSAVSLVFYNRINALLIGLKESKKYNLLNLAAYSTSIVFVYVVANVFTPSPSELFFVFSIAQFACSTIFINLLRFNPRDFHLKYVRELLPYLLSSVSVLLVPNLSHLLVRNKLLEFSVTLSADTDVLWKFSALNMLLPTTLLSVYFLPRVSGDVISTLKENRIVLGFIYIILMMAGILFVVYGGNIIELLLSEGYKSLGSYLGILVVLEVLRVTGLIGYNFLLGNRRIGAVIIADMSFWITYFLSASLLIEFNRKSIVLILEAYGIASLIYVVTVIVLIIKNGKLNLRDKYSYPIQGV